MTPDDGRGELLKDACDSILAESDFEAHDGKTFCNVASLMVAQAMGCDEFDTPDGEDPLMADEMIGLMSSNVSGHWTVGTGSEATIHALGGGLAFAAMSSHDLGEAHGHIAVIAPKTREFSGSLKKEVPVCANAGRLMKVSQAFPVSKGEPMYFLFDVA
jgi:hypothetical protein